MAGGSTASHSRTAASSAATTCRATSRMHNLSIGQSTDAAFKTRWTHIAHRSRVRVLWAEPVANRCDREPVCIRNSLQPRVVLAAAVAKDEASAMHVQVRTTDGHLRPHGPEPRCQVWPHYTALQVCAGARRAAA